MLNAGIPAVVGYPAVIGVSAVAGFPAVNITFAKDFPSTLASLLLLASSNVHFVPGVHSD
jgi:hypothetical protein